MVRVCDGCGIELYCQFGGQDLYRHCWDAEKGGGSDSSQATDDEERPTKRRREDSESDYRTNDDSDDNDHRRPDDRPEVNFKEMRQSVRQGIDQVMASGHWCGFSPEPIGECLDLKASSMFLGRMEDCKNDDVQLSRSGYLQLSLNSDGVSFFKSVWDNLYGEYAPDRSSHPGSQTS